MKTTRFMALLPAAFCFAVIHNAQADNFSLSIGTPEPDVPSRYVIEEPYFYVAQPYVYYYPPYYYERHHYYNWHYWGHPYEDHEHFERREHFEREHERR